MTATTNLPTGDEYLKSMIRHFKAYKTLGDKTLAVLDDRDLNFIPAEGSNSIAIIIRHMHGNMLSRFTNLLTEDGEKPWRQRDQEFDPPQNWQPGAGELKALWEEGWNCMLDAIQALKGDQLLQQVTIRTEPLLVMDAINRQLAHHASHVGQIIYIGKMIKGRHWTSLSIARGQSGDYNKTMAEAPKK